ncbi:hypothetical protein LKL35_36805 [Streptomyces sp. ET3-23]|uniref:hypothetical protein n=1 Tax=Streptomyces sp. ET3-23 TaxID=2885643 RepID=UPI001D12C48F|nr:hypothetical protein [Streptomyces sp. ET3-23]MCC2280886.1 hypothetical protein [Streptomyces sp. ET3-23]
MRQAGEQCVAETGRSTPTVQDVPHSGQLDIAPAWTASVLARARRIRRQCRERHADEQNTAVALAAGANGPPHPRHNRGPVSSSGITTSRSRGAPFLPIPAPYAMAEASYLTAEGGLAPQAMRDLQTAAHKQRLDIDDPQTAVAMAGGALLGVLHLLETRPELDARHVTDELAARLLRMFGLPRAEAQDIAARPLPALNAD